MISAPTKTPGQVYEGIAFTFCKCATVALLCGRFVLPIAAYLCAVFFVMAYAKGERSTKCILGPPLVVALVWAVVGTVALVLILNPTLAPEILRRLGR